MNRLPLVALTALVLMSQVIVAQPSSKPEQPIAPAPTGLALEITYSKDRPPAFSPVGGPCCKPVGAWYTLFGISQPSTASRGLLPVQAVDVRSRLEGELVQVTVSVFRGVRFLEKEEQVATYRLREDESVRAAELTDFGVDPFEIKVIRVNPNLIYRPAVSTKVQSIAVVGIEINSTPLPSYKLRLHNSSDRNVVAMGIHVMANDRLRRSALPQGRDGGALFKARETAEINVGAAYDAQNTLQGYRPEPPPQQEIVITSVVFDDGTFEGDIKMAATFTAFVAGRRIQIAKLIGLIDATASLSDVTVGDALERLSAQADSLSIDADAAVVDHVRKSFSKLTISESGDLKTSVDVALQAVKADFVQRVKEFEKRNPHLSNRQFRTWLRAIRLGYEQWLSRLSNETSDL